MSDPPPFPPPRLPHRAFISYGHLISFLIRVSHLPLYSLQKFKLNIANTVITQENASLSTMNTDQLLDLFQLTDTETIEKKVEKAEGKASMKEILEDLEELWDERQYQEEYNIDTFLESLKS